MADRYQAWIEGAAAERPQLAAALAELGELYHRKLWHQLTERLEALLDSPAFQESGFAVQLYQNFVAGFAHKINLLKLAFFAVAVSKQMAKPEVRGCLWRQLLGAGGSCWVHGATAHNGSRRGGRGAAWRRCRSALVRRQPPPTAAAAPHRPCRRALPSSRT